MAATAATLPRDQDLASIDAQPIAKHLPAADRARAQRWHDRRGADCRQDAADLASDLRLEAWMRRG